VFCREFRLPQHKLRRALRQARRVSVFGQQATNGSSQVGVYRFALSPIVFSIFVVMSVWLILSGSVPVSFQ